MGYRDRDIFFQIWKIDYNMFSSFVSIMEMNKITNLKLDGGVIYGQAQIRI